MGTSTLFSHFLHLSSPLFTYFTILHLISPLTPPSLTFLHLLSPLFSPLYSTITRSLYLHLSSPLSSPFFTIHKPTPHWDDNKNLNTPQVSARTSHEVKRASNSPSTPTTKQTLFPHGHTNGTILHLFSPLTPPFFTFFTFFHLFSPLFSPLYSPITRSLFFSPFFTFFHLTILPRRCSFHR